MRLFDSKLTSLDVSNLNSLQYLNVSSGNENLETIIFSQNDKLATLYCNNTNISYLDLSDCPNLSTLVCNQTNISTLNLINNSKLALVQCNNGILTSVDFSGCTKLKYIYCQNNPNLTYLNVSGCTNLTELKATGCGLAYVDLSDLVISDDTVVELSNNIYTVPAATTTVDVSTISGFDKTKVDSVVSGGTFDAENGIFTFADGSDTITYDYDVGGGFGNVQFSIVRTNLRG